MTHLHGGFVAAASDGNPVTDGGMGYAPGETQHDHDRHRPAAGRQHDVVQALTLFEIAPHARPRRNSAITCGQSAGSQSRCITNGG